VAVFGGGYLNLVIDAGEEVPSTRVWGLVADIDVLVFEEAHPSAEPCAQLNEGIMTLGNPQIDFHRNQSF
jgi:hypothetical protein